MLKKKPVIHLGCLARTHHLPIWLSVLAITVTSCIVLPTESHGTNAASCPDLKIIFARGSGATRYDNADYQSFKASLESKLETSNLSYEFDDLDYPAVGVGIENFSNIIGAYIGAGESYAFGDSVKAGAKELANIVNNNVCKNTKYVLGGYSQGAIVLLKALEQIQPERIIYAATFGDPKIYLPEGEGLLPAACRGDNLSEYRIYVPDCYAHTGLLGARDPYAPSGYSGKVGTWCNKFDIFCSSHYSISSHISYVADGLYEDAAKLIFSKIAAAFNFKNAYTSPHDTAFLIDSTGSMSEHIDEYKAEALRLARQTLNAGGRVALYDYRDLIDSYIPVEHCGFDTCTLESFEEGLENIIAEGGDDEPESLLSASLHVMSSQSWRLGSTKSLVILTDAGYHSPDLDGTTFYDVKTLSKKIDPVNFYIITTPEHYGDYESLAQATDGAVMTLADDLSILTDTIMERYDSLPRVEEDMGNSPIPSLIVDSMEFLSPSETRVNFTTDAPSTIVLLDDVILGITNETSITFSNLDSITYHEVVLTPLSQEARGESVILKLHAGNFNLADGYGQSDGIVSVNINEEISPVPEPIVSLTKSTTFLTENTTPSTTEQPITIPKAPNTGRR